MTASRLQTSGFAYCMASTNSSVIPMTTLISFGSSASFKNMSSPAFMTINGLTPSESYFVFCGIRTSTGFVSSSRAIQAVRGSVKTLCCRSVSFTSAPSFVYGSLSMYTTSSSSKYTFYYTISYLPSAAVEVTPVLTALTTSSKSASDISILPKSTTFTKSSTSTIGSFVLSGNTFTEGSYSLSLTMSSASNTTVASYSLPKVTVNVISSQSPLPAPNMTKAMFSDSGSYVYVYFDVETDNAGISDVTFTCSKLFSFVSAEFSTCSFLNSSTVQISFPAGTNRTLLVPGSSVQLLSGLIRSQCIIGSVCSKNFLANATSVNIRLPITPLIPTVIVNVAEYVSGCNNLSVDGTSSYGHGGRLWTSAVWEVSSSTSNSETVFGIHQYLSQVSYSVNQIISIPSTLLGNEKYTISLTLTNFLGYTATGAGVVNVNGNINLPVLTVSGGNAVTFYAYQTITVSCVATVSQCATTNKINYTTSLYLNDVLQTSKSIASDPRQFKLSPYSISAGYTYRVKFTAQAASTSAYPSVTATTNAYITIARGSVVALIKGGNVLQSPVDKSVTLDASSSYDEDSTSSVLSYLWSCSVTSVLSLGLDCSKAISSSLSSSSLVIPANTLNVSLSYRFTVLVSSVDGRTATASVSMQPKSSGYIQVSITTSSTIMNIGNKVTLAGSISSKAAVNAFWTVYYAGSETNITALTSMSNVFTAIEATANITYPLIFPANSFSAGRSYTIRLTAYPTKSKTSSSYTETTIVMNIPPAGGIASVSPVVGYSLSTSFYISCSLWTSSNLPLQYLFAYQISSSSPLLTIGSLSQAAFAISTLPAGLESSSYVITLVNYAYDSYSAFSDTNTTVTSQYSTFANITQTLKVSFANSILSGNVDAALQTVNNIASIANAVNCSATTKDYCSSLNRGVCQTVSNLCGSCFTGFTGIVGPSNTLCLNITKTSTKSSNGISFGESGASCSTSSDCIYANCVNNICITPNKTCASGSNSVCSGQGTCEFIDTSGNVVSSCLVTNTNCYAKCICDSGYSGTDCSLSPVTAVERDSLRTSLCDGISSIYSLQGASSATLQTLAGSLQSSFSPDEVTSSSGLSSCGNALSTVTSLASQGYLSQASTSTLSAITSTISLFIAKAAVSSSSTASSYVSSAVTQFTAGVLQTLSDGEPPIELVSDNIQMYIQKTKLTELSGASLKPPQTDEEKAYNSLNPQLTLSSSGLSACYSGDYAQLSIAKYTKNPNYNSDDLQTTLLKIATYSSSSSSRRLTAASRSVKLSKTPLYYLTLPFSQKQSFNFSIDITSNAFNKLNPDYVLPVCTVYNGYENVPCSNCNVSRITNYNVTYGCYDMSLLCGLSSSRRLEESDRYLATLTNSGSEFGSRIDTYKAPTSSPTSVPTTNPQLPQILSLSLTSSKTTITAKVSLTAKRQDTSGFIYCLASSNSSISSMSFLMSYGYSASFKNMSNSIPITMTSLTPSKSYYVYCGIKTSNGFKSSPVAILSMRKSIRTLCCRSATFSSVPLYVYGDLGIYSAGSSSKYTYYYSISYLPEHALTVTPILTSNSASSSSLSSISIIPASITFTSLSTSIIGSFILSGTSSTEGQYLLSLNFSSASNETVSAYTSSSAVTEIISLQSPLPAPNMTQAIFSDSGAFVFISFSVNTDNAGITNSSFACSQLFSGISAICSFVNSSTVSVSFATGSTLLNVGNIITLLPSKLRAQCLFGTTCSKNIAADALSVSVKAPKTPLTPTVTLNVPSQSGSCNNLTIDATTSSGNAGRSWKTVTWTVTGSESSVNAANIQSYLNRKGKNVFNLVSVPSSLLGSETYVIRLTLTNFLGSSSSASASVSIVGNANLPTLTVVGGSVAKFYAYQTVSVSCVATVSSCATTKKIDYTSAIFLNGIQLGSKSTASDSRIFKLDPYVLDAGYTYIVKFNATVAQTTQYSAITASTSLSVTILRGLVIAIIKGGSSRQIPQDNSLTLDASLSSDEDSSSAVLSYRWSCTITSILSFGTDCSSVFGTSSITLSSITIAANKLDTSYLYTFQVLVSSPDGRFSTASTTVEPSAAGGVTLTITSTTSIINADSKLSLNGYLAANYTGSTSVYAFWSVYFEGSVVSVKTITSSALTFSAAEIYKTIAFPVAYSSNTFVQGRTYTFRLTAYPITNSGLSSYAETSVTINSPPSGGVLSVSPSKGDALVTSFYISTSLWVSNNLPLQYSFTYKISSSQPELVLGSYNQIPYVYTSLPAGLAAFSYYVTLYSYASDSYGAISSVSTKALVKLQTGADVSSVLSSSLSTSFSSGNIDGAVQAVNNIAATVNAVNCSGASATLCASLNRDICQSQSNLCGSCLSGYIGVSGSSNSMCLSESSSEGTKGSACLTNSDCVLGFCDDFVCSDPPKTCFSSSGQTCTGNGNCTYFDTSNNILSSCKTTDTACYAKCVCFADSNGDSYGGSDCSLLPAESVTRGLLRKSLCDAIITMYSSQGASSSTLQTLATSLQTAFQSDEVTTLSGIQSCVSALKIVAGLVSSGYLKSITTSSVTIAAVSSTLSNFVSKASAISDSIDTSFVNTVFEDLSTGVMQTLVNGESALEVSSDNVQYSVQRTRITELASSSLSPPQTTSETSYGSLGPSIILPSTGLSGCSFSSGYSKIIISKYTKNPNINSSSVETPVLKFDSISSASSSVSSDIFRSNDALQAMTSRYDAYLTQDPLFYIVLQFSSAKNFSFDGISQDSIAGNSTIPSCSIFNGIENVPCSGCNISSYTNYNVTFGCYDLSLLCSISSSRRLNAHHASPLDGIMTQDYVAHVSRFLESNDGDDGGTNNAVSGSQFGAILSALVAQLSSVLSYNPFALDPAKAKGILSFLGCLIITVICGLTYFSRMDQFELIELNEKKKLSESKDVVLVDRKQTYDFEFDLKSLFTNRKHGNLIGSMHKYVKNNVALSKIKAKVKGYGNPLAEQLKYMTEEIKTKGRSQAIIVAFLESVAPRDLLKDVHPFTRIRDYVFKFHDFTAAFSGPSLQNPRFFRFLDLVRIVLIGLFCDTLFYGVFYPDDGTCETYTDKTTCLASINKASNRPTCAWTKGSGDKAGSCYLRSQPSSFTFTVIIALLTILVGLPLEMILSFIQYNFCRLRPRLEEINLSSEYWLGVKVAALEADFERVHESEKEYEDLTDSYNISKYDDITIHTRKPRYQQNHGTNQEANGSGPKGSTRSSVVLKQLLDNADEMRKTNMRTNYDDDDEALKTSLKDLYHDQYSIEEEVNYLLKRVHAFLSKYIQQGYNTWTESKETGILNQTRTAAILQKLDINPDGSFVPMTLFQRLLHGNARNRITAKLESARYLSYEMDSILKQSPDIHKDAILLQYFILEQFSSFKRFCLSREFFIYNDCPPPSINPILWIISWIFISSSYVFFLYWIFAWGVKNGGTTLAGWGMNFGIGAMQDIFFVQIAKIYIVRCIGIESTKPQLRNIYRVLNDLMMKYTLSGQPLDHEIKVVQFTSAACRTARQSVCKDLPSATILKTLDDADALRCKEGSAVPLGVVSIILIAFPAIFALVSDVLSDIALDTALPSFFVGFLLANNFLYEISVFVLFVPYAVAASLGIWLYIVLHPSIRRVQKLKTNSRAYNVISEWKKYRRDSRISWIRSYVRLIRHDWGDLQARAIYSFLSLQTYQDKEYTKAKHVNQWKFMNAPSALQGIISPMTSKAYERHQTMDNILTQQSTVGTASIPIPDAIYNLFVKHSKKIVDDNVYLTTKSIRKIDPYGFLASEPASKEQMSISKIIQDFTQRKNHKVSKSTYASANTTIPESRSQQPLREIVVDSDEELSDEETPRNEANIIIHEMNARNPKIIHQVVKRINDKERDQNEIQRIILDLIDDHTHALNRNLLSINQSFSDNFAHTDYTTNQVHDEVDVKVDMYDIYHSMMDESAFEQSSPSRGGGKGMDRNKSISKSIYLDDIYDDNSFIAQNSSFNNMNPSKTMRINLRLEQTYSLETLVDILRKVWSKYTPKQLNRIEIVAKDIEEIENSFILFMLAREDYLHGLKLKAFIAWVGDIAEKVVDAKAYDVVFQSPSIPPRRVGFHGLNHAKTSNASSNRRSSIVGRSLPISKPEHRKKVSNAISRSTGKLFKRSVTPIEFVDEVNRMLHEQSEVTVLSRQQTDE